MRIIARQLMAAETLAAPAETAKSASFRATDKLRPHLSMLMGRSGFQALLARSLRLANAEVRWLGAVQVDGAGELHGLTVAHATLDAAQFAEGEIALLAQLLGLLVAFIGPALTLRLITQTWPQLSFGDADFGEAAE